MRNFHCVKYKKIKIKQTVLLHTKEGGNASV